MKILIQYLKPYTPLIALTLLLAAVNQVFSMMDPWILGIIIDKLLDHHRDFEANAFTIQVLKYIGLAIGAAMVSRIAKNFQDYFLNTITLKLGAQIYTDGLKHSLELPYQVFEDQRSGETLGILQKVRTDVEKLISSFVNILFTSLVGIIWVMGLSLMMSWYIGPLYLISIPILGIVSSVLSRKIKAIQKRIVGETTSLSGSTTESLRNIELVKSLGLANQEINRLNSTTIKILGLELEKVKYIRSISFIQGTIVNLLRNSILFLMMLLIFQESLTKGQFVTFFIYSFFIFGPLQELGNIILVYREAEVSLQNFQRIMLTKSEPTPEAPKTLSALNHISFNDVRFKHLTAKEYAVDQISFHVSRGETIAFVGPSGSGKSTLVKLLVGLYQPVSGQIIYNQIDSRQIALNELRSQIGFVTQETQLFAGTIRENLLFVNPAATDTEMLNALSKASCNSLLQRAEKGLDTTIGEGGVKVSGGEKQRLSIARALLRKPNLIVFDEATSALDSITEEEISTTIRQINADKNVITILIAHRLSTIMHADKIYVLEKGALAECGKHDELLNLKGLYYAMWRQQIGERKV
ncbi:MAG: ABC transporter ATP-binding protein/permease [Bacteroidetes bacterium]|nr:ABC transporter ATP-binding protein/permease [Bacteroidota bacterium]